MIGIGVDLCGIERMEKNLENTRFLEKFFTPEERRYIAGRGAAGAESAAAAFAAKEAFLKALGIGISGGIRMDEIGVIHGENGAPSYELKGAAAEKLRAAGAERALLSLTHESGLACAFCVLEEGERRL